MDNSVMGSGIFTGPTAGILDVQPSIHRHERGHLGQISHHDHTQQAINSMAGFKSDPSMGLMETKGFSMKKGIVTTAATNSNNFSNNTSEEDEPSFTEDGNDPHFNGVTGKKGSPWHRMKWTDDIVKLLITLVSCVGDDGVPDGVDGMKRKFGILQKKGKWKTISKLMMERGCYVSPQQCEDKFNDLNKRYKRVNEILGRGTTCRVVENPVLLDSMPQISAKMKDDVRKILSSKHLFYKEMCAYHNGQRIPDSHDLDLQGCSQPVTMYSKDIDGFDEEDDDDDDSEDCDDDNSDNEENKKNAESERIGKFFKKKLNEEDGTFGAEMTTKSPWEYRELVKQRMLKLNEQRVSFQAQAFEIEKRVFKWQRFRSKKDRELERLRLENERMRLENERMALQMKQKELEIDYKMSEESLNLMSFGMDRPQEKDQIELGRVQ